MQFRTLCSVAVTAGSVMILAIVGTGTALTGDAKELPSQLSAQAVKRVKQATVYLRVTLPSGKVSEGSGFLAVEPGVVITNAHVLGMLTAISPAPNKIEVVLQSGESNEKSLPGKVLGVDSLRDLAVLRVEGELPAPLQLGRGDDLFETQKLYVFGFPFGAQLGKNITVSESSISSLRREGGSLEKIQVNGGMHPGNSGGPVVDTAGQVVGVAVAGIRGTQINFAIPALGVEKLLEGGIQEAKAGEMFRDKQGVSVPVRYACLDPCGRIREVRVEVWAGKPDAKRNVAQKYQPETGDGPCETVILKYANGVATGDVTLPQLAAGQVAWVQPVLKLAKGTLYGRPESFDTSLALERIPIDLIVKLPHQTERTVRLKAMQSLTLSRGKDKHINRMATEFEILELLTLDSKRTRIRTGLGVPKVTVDDNGKKSTGSNALIDILQKLPPNFIVDETNKVRRRVDMASRDSMPPVLRQNVGDVYSQMCAAYEATNFIMPNRRVKPGESWQVAIPIVFRSVTTEVIPGPKPGDQGLPRPGVRPPTPGVRPPSPKPGPRPANPGFSVRTETKAEVVDLHGTCTYEGMRSVDGAQYALISIAGHLHGGGFSKDHAKVAGKFTFDSERGFINTVTMKIATDIVLASSDIQAGVAFDIDLDRVAGNPNNLRVPASLSSGPSDTPQVDNGKDPKGEANRPETPVKAVEPLSKSKLPRPSPSKKPSSYLSIVSTEGDLIGQGKSYEYPGSEVIVKLATRGVDVRVDGWILRIGAPKKQFLEVGTYAGARRLTPSGTSPQLDLFGKGRLSKEPVGEFVVWELETDGPRIVRLAVDFVLRGEVDAPPLHGRLRLNSSFE